VGETAFAHPAERELARVFDEHGVRWEYEPRTFVLSRNPDGSVKEAFTPDFFLPGHGLYIELTVMRQPLTSRKSRKARRVGELYGVPVEIMFRRDVLRLSHRWQLHRLQHAALRKAA
jgi:hypoxanthine phosphoribosyltransferase